MDHLSLHLNDSLTGVALVPAPIEILGDPSKLDDQIVVYILRLDFAALLAPQPNEIGLIIAHDDPGIGAADEGAAITRIESDRDVSGCRGCIACIDTRYCTHEDLLEVKATLSAALPQPRPNT